MLLAEFNHSDSRVCTDGANIRVAPEAASKRQTRFYVLLVVGQLRLIGCVCGDFQDAALGHATRRAGLRSLIGVAA
jgi:hypothetical protein